MSSIMSGFTYLKNALDFNTSITDGDEIVIYVPPSVLYKLKEELSQIQRYPQSDKGFTPEIIIHNLFKVRLNKELQYLESILHQIRRIVE